MEEYKSGDSEFCGNVPEFGAIFMANTETLKVCFKRKIFGLPSVQANFVKQIKVGMPLFLFEYEKRQLFGVYRAASDGGVDIMPQVFSSLKKQFPAQVRFTPLWICRPLSESDFKVAISENYYSPKKFKFGLSEEQVWRLLQLFSTRMQYSMLPPRQLIKDFHQSPIKVGEQVGGDRSSAIELFEKKHVLEDFSSSAIHPFMDDEVDDEGKGIFRQDFMADGSLIKIRRMNSERTDTDLNRSCDRLLESRVESPDLYLDNERIPPNSVIFSRGSNTFSFPDTAVAPNFTRESLDLRKRAERHYCFDGKDRIEAEDGRSLTDGIMRSEVDLDPFHLDPRYGVKMNDGSYEGYLVREGGKNRNDKVLMTEKVLGLNHKDNYVRLGSLSEKFGTPLDREKRRNEEQRFSSVDNQIKTSYIDCLDRSTSLNSSRNDTGVESQLVDGYMFNRQTSAINELDTVNVTRAGISPKYNALSSSECLNMSFPDVHFADYNRNYHTYDPIFHDDIVRRRIPDPPSLHHGRSSPMVVGQSASLARDTNPYLSHSNYRASSRGKTCEADGIGRSHTSDVGNKVPGHIYSDYRDCALTENSDSISLRSASAAEYRGVQFFGVGYGSSPLDDRCAIDFHPYGVSPKYLSCQMPEEIFTSCEVQSPKPYLTDSDLQNQEYDAVNDELAFYNNVYNSHLKKDNRGYNSSECGASTGSGKQRKSVFARLASSSRIPDQAKDTDTDIYSPVDELMEILRQGEKFSVKKMKRKRPAVEQLGEGEMKKKSAMTSHDNCLGKSDVVFVPEKLIGEANKAVFVPKKLTGEANKAVDGTVHETLTETRAVEFRRRRENNRSIICEKTEECRDVKKENDKSVENVVEPKIQMDKQSKRRKLVRPVFAVNLNNKPSAPSETTDNSGSCVNSATNGSDGDGTHV